MSDTDSVPDDVPVADAVEQSRPAAESDESESLDLDERPLEADESDWQEQHVAVEDPDDDVR